MPGVGRRLSQGAETPMEKSEFFRKAGGRMEEKNHI
jgi:hypothetical protein